jgi:hypothetical protein
MKVLGAAIVCLFCLGCTTTPSVKAPADYITGLTSPVTLKNYVLILDGGSGGLNLTDALGREVWIYQDAGGANKKGRTQSWYGREIGSVVLADLKTGRPLKYNDTEGERLLMILQSLSVRGDEERGVGLVTDFIKKKRGTPSR